MQLRSGKIMSETESKNLGAPRYMHLCGHKCEMWFKNKCCTCMGKRAKNIVTLSFSQSLVKDAIVANRKIGYCPCCRKI